MAKRWIKRELRHPPRWRWDLCSSRIPRQ